MSAAPVPCAWWHTGAPPRVEPLEVVRTVVGCLQRNEVVPEPAAAAMAKALSSYLEGKTDISANLGLRPCKGGRYEAPLAVEKRSRRDELIVKLYSAQADGTKRERSERVAVLLKSPPATDAYTPDELAAGIAELHEKYAGDLPTSARQIDRVVSANKV